MSCTTPPTIDLGDAKHPFNYPRSQKRVVFVVGLICAFNGTLGSSLPSNATTSLSQYFGIPKSSVSLVLLNSLYMIGFAVAPPLLAPLSETVGRRPVLVGSYTCYAIFTLCCAVAPTYTALLIFRLLAGTSASVPNAVVAGLYTDTFADPKTRGRAVAAFMLISSEGPMIGPLISGLLSVNLGWRWVFWAGFIIAGVGLPVVWLLPETYLPVLEQRFTAATGNSSFWSGWRLWDQALLRPGLMLVREPILLLASIYLAFIYGLMYLFFQSYPVVYGSVYGLSQEMVGLAYIPMMMGGGLAFAIFILFGEYRAKCEILEHPWTTIEEYRRLPLACFGGPLIPAALLVMGFTARTEIHPAVSMVLCGILFGTGYLLVFFAMLIYLSDTYKRYSASAQASASTVRSLTAVCLPFSAPTMYHNLGVQYASITLACISGVMAVLPIAFLFFKGVFRGRSVFSG